MGGGGGGGGGEAQKTKLRDTKLSAAIRAEQYKHNRKLLMTDVLMHIQLLVNKKNKTIQHGGRQHGSSVA